MDKLWQAAIAVAGLGGIASFVLWSLYKQWLKLPIFQQLTKDQLFRLFRWFLILTFLFALSALVAYVVVSVYSENGSKKLAQKGKNDLVEVLQKRAEVVVGGLDRLSGQLEQKDRTWAAEFKARFMTLNLERVRAINAENQVLVHELGLQMQTMKDECYARMGSIEESLKAKAAARAAAAVEKTAAPTDKTGPPPVVVARDTTAADEAEQLRLIDLINGGMRTMNDPR